MKIIPVFPTMQIMQIQQLQKAWNAERQSRSGGVTRNRRSTSGRNSRADRTVSRRRCEGRERNRGEKVTTGELAGPPPVPLFVFSSFSCLSKEKSQVNVATGRIRQPSLLYTSPDPLTTRSYGLFAFQDKKNQLFIKQMLNYQMTLNLIMDLIVKSKLSYN